MRFQNLKTRNKNLIKKSEFNSDNFTWSLLSTVAINVNLFNQLITEVIVEQPLASTGSANQ